mmetsp:Transcript_40269/g.106831  ORF Transcript_40269/g.106831 Transcript_40269/m.106831 type:complete len:243 (+) Transcript_40269:1198-1926(+)
MLDVLAGRIHPPVEGRVQRVRLSVHLAGLVPEFFANVMRHCLAGKIGISESNVPCLDLLVQCLGCRRVRLVRSLVHALHSISNRDVRARHRLGHRGVCEIVTPTPHVSNASLEFLRNLQELLMMLLPVLLIRRGEVLRGHIEFPYQISCGMFQMLHRSFHGPPLGVFACLKSTVLNGADLLAQGLGLSREARPRITNELVESACGLPKCGICILTRLLRGGQASLEAVVDTPSQFRRLLCQV